MYIVTELQTTGGQTANITTAYGDRNAAEAQFHAILAAAASSAVEVHAAVMVSEEGFPLRHECYKHAPAHVSVEEPAEE